MWESLKSRFKEVKTLYKSETVKILKVEETSSNENFVLKLIHKKISNNNELARLRQEFKILNNSEFTHSVNCHELIEGEEGICLKLEYFDGSSLKKLIDDKPLTIARFLNIAIKCCESLQEIK